MADTTTLMAAVPSLLFNLITILLLLLYVQVSADGTVHMAIVKTLPDDLANHRINVLA